MTPETPDKPNTPHRPNIPTRLRLRLKHTIRNRKDDEKAHRIDHEQIAGLITATIADAGRLPSFALKLVGDALAPDFLDGDLLTVAPDVLAVPGDCVVALIGGKYGAMLLNADGDAWDRAGGFVPLGSYSVVGVVLDRTPRD